MPNESKNQLPQCNHKGYKSEKQHSVDAESREIKKPVSLKTEGMKSDSARIAIKPTCGIKELKKSLLFENAPDVVLNSVAEIVKEIKIKPSDILIHKGDVGDSMYIISKGKVRVHDGNLHLNYLLAGDTFGEMAALDGELRTASITAIEDTDLLELKQKDLLSLVEKEPEVSKCLIHFLCQRGKTFSNDITSRAFKLRAIEREFEIGQEIQKGFLPEEIPEIENWDIAAYFKAAREVAGDFYDLFEVDNQNKLVFVIGDVCGKGVGAALFMTLFRSLIRASLVSGDLSTWANVDNKKSHTKIWDSRQLLMDSVNLTNNYVAKTHGSACMFATIFIGILDIHSGELLYVNAGHESPVIFTKDGKIELSTTGPAVGLFEGEEYNVENVTLNPQDQFIAYTDGVTEAIDKNDNQFTTARLLDCIRSKPSSMSESLDHVVSELSKFTKGVEQFDDITLLTIKNQ